MKTNWIMNFSQCASLTSNSVEYYFLCRMLCQAKRSLELLHLHSLEIMCDRRRCCVTGRLRHRWLIDKQREEATKSEWTAVLFVAMEACVSLRRQRAPVELLIVHLITVAWCLSQGWLRIKHIWECQHVPSVSSSFIIHAQLLYL